MNDEDFLIRRTMENWHEGMNDHIENVMSRGITPEPKSYQRDAIVRQLSKGGSVLETYTMKSIFPVSIDAIPLNWEDTDSIEQFEVEFALDYWRPVEDIGQDFGASFDSPPNARGSINIGASFDIS